MDHLTFEYLSGDELVETFGKEEIERYTGVLRETLEKFLEQEDLSDSVDIDLMRLSAAAIDYFNDVKRIKNFHKNIKKINSEKEVAYTSYWLLQRAPLQIKTEALGDGKNSELANLNERFVLQYISNYLSARQRKAHLLLREERGLVNFSKVLLYFLIYRLHSPLSLELMLYSFMAGQMYENTEEDLSAEMHPYDKEAPSGAAE